MFVNFISSSTYFRPHSDNEDDKQLQTTNASDDECDDFENQMKKLISNELENQTARSTPAMSAMPEPVENSQNPDLYNTFLGQELANSEELSKKMTEEFAYEVPDDNLDGANSNEI